MQKQRNRSQKDKPRRGLIIGIGGVHGEVLESYRRRVIAKFGSLEQEPHLGGVCGFLKSIGGAPASEVSEEFDGDSKHAAKTKLG